MDVDPHGGSEAPVRSGVALSSLTGVVSGEEVRTPPRGPPCEDGGEASGTSPDPGTRDTGTDPGSRTGGGAVLVKPPGAHCARQPGNGPSRPGERGAQKPDTEPGRGDVYDERLEARNRSKSRPSSAAAASLRRGTLLLLWTEERCSLRKQLSPPQAQNALPAALRGTM